ncbi:MAG: hypothetical protein K6F61_05120 [Clostridiales bacterium]|nr:hypothetical protein [Clostridiales bacterium]
MEATVWIPIGLSCVMAIVAIITLAKNTKKDSDKEIEQRATMTADIKYIRDSMDTIKVDNRKIQSDVGDLKIKVIEIERDVRSAHKRLDDMQGGKKHED